MRKLLVAAVGFFTLLTALPVYAVDVNFSGEVRVRGFWTDNLTDGNASTEDATRFNDLRFRLKTMIKAGVTTGVVVLDMGNCFAGADVATINGGAAAGGTTTGDCRFGAAGLGGSFNTVGVREAHLEIDLSNVRAILGRQTVKLGHGIVLDDTVDAITLVFPMGGATLTGSLLQVADAADAIGFPGADINNDTSIWLVNLGMDHGSHIINLYDALLYDQQGAGTIPPFTSTGFSTSYPTGVIAASAFATADKIWYNILGLSLDAKSGALALAAEASYTIGQISNATAGVDARVRGWNLMGDVTADTGGAKVGATVVYAAGTDQNATGDVTADDISGNFQLGNILLNNEQTSDRNGGSLGGGLAGMGIAAIKAHVSMMPSEKLTVSGALIYALTTQLCSGASTALNGGAGGLCAGPGGNREIGTEVDLNAAYAVDSNLTFNAGAGYLFTGDGAQDFYSGAPSGGPADSDIWKLSAKAVFTF